MSFTNQDLIDFVNVRCMSPSSTSTITDSDILRFADAEILGMVSPLLNSAKAGYNEVVYDTALVPNQASYAIPSRAFGDRVVALFLLNSSGNAYSIPVVGSTDTVATSANNAPYSPLVAYIRGSNIVLNPVPSTSTDSLRVVFHMRPSKLTETASAATVTNVTSTVITVDAMPAGLTTGVAFDVIENSPPYGIKRYDQTGAVSGNNITMTAVPSGVAVGDYVALAGESPVINLPHELHPIVWQRTAARILETLGDSRGAAMLYRATDEYLSQFMNIVTPRVDATPQVVNPDWYKSRYWGL